MPKDFDPTSPLRRAFLFYSWRDIRKGLSDSIKEAQNEETDCVIWKDWQMTNTNDTFNIYFFGKSDNNPKINEFFKLKFV